MAVHFILQPAVHKDYNFSTFLPKLIFCLLDYNHFSGYELTVVLICISLMANDVEHLFLCLLAFSISLEKCLFRFLPIFKLGCLLLLGCMSCVF